MNDQNDWKRLILAILTGATLFFSQQNGQKINAVQADAKHAVMEAENASIRATTTQDTIQRELAEVKGKQPLQVQP